MKKLFRLILLLAVLAGLAIWKVPGLYRDVSYYWTEHTEAEETVKKYADAHGLRYSAYPQKLIDLLERNPETEDFVCNYPNRDKITCTYTEFDRSNGVPLLLQWDTAWGYTQYGSDMLAITGCGPTCLAMAGYYLTGDMRFTPDQVAEFAEKNGYYAKGYGSSWTLISEGGIKLGLDVVEIPLVKQRMTDNLDVGNLIICAMGPGDFTTTGHYIVLTGVEDGAFRVNDPNSVQRSEALWTYEQIESQIKNLWVVR